MILNVVNVKKTFLQGTETVPVLRGLNLSVSEGETVAILGESGSGKSTLLSLLAGLDHPDEGSVAIAGTVLKQLDEEALTQFRGKRLGIVFQQFHLMSTLTALENIALPLEIARDPEATAKAATALESVGLKARAAHFPSQLSGGECQRVAIARALVMRPALLLADEPSGNLDTRTGTTVMDLLFDLVQANRMTLILVTHNEGLAKRCHRQMVIADGQLKDVSRESV